jgi:hypothetical protein
MTTKPRVARAADTNVFASTAQAEGIAAGSSGTASPTPKRLARAYERFLGMPVLVVLGVMWVTGAVLLGSCALALYIVGSLLVRAMVGSP